YANVDTEAERFLEFERWWSGFFMMNEQEIRWIVENLFIGNRLAHGQARFGDERIDLRNIRSPIIVFASHGDNITPPQQALNWIVDLYRDVSEIKARGQRIVYLLHDRIGHRGICVPAKIAGREHEAITDTMRAIEALPPGLYEMVLEQGADRLHIKFVPRTIDDILRLDDGRDDEEPFAAVDRVSEFNARAYELFWRPLVRSVVTDQTAKLLFHTRPLRLERIAFSDQNPLMSPVAALARPARDAAAPARHATRARRWPPIIRSLRWRRSSPSTSSRASTCSATCAMPCSRSPSTPSTARRGCGCWERTGSTRAQTPRPRTC